MWCRKSPKSWESGRRQSVLLKPLTSAAIALLGGAVLLGSAGAEPIKDLTKDPAERAERQAPGDAKDAKDAKDSKEAKDSKDPAKESAGTLHSLLGGAVHYRPPEGWVESQKAAKEDTAAYAWPDHDSMLSVWVLPTDAKISQAAAGKIIQSLRAMHQKAKEPLVKAPAVEKDPRFLLRIHEKFKTGENHDQPAEQLQLYRQVGPRVVLVTVKTAAASEEDAKAALTAGEDAALSVAYERQ